MNTYPSISVIMPTCGRVNWLKHAMHSFIKQEYEGVCELVILNSFPRQTIKTPFRALDDGRNPVWIINLEKRPENLGQCRNLAIDEAHGEIIVILDDDDYALSHHLHTIGAAFREDPLLQWVWLDKQFWGWGDTIKSIVPGQCPCFAFTRNAWKSVGGYPNLTVGEDRQFISEITKAHKGKRVEIKDGIPSFIYCWNNGAYHASGQGDDQPGVVGAYDRFWQDLQRRVAGGAEPTGVVEIVPECPINWLELAQAHMAELKKKSMSDLCVVQLGRYGDIVNMLPVLQKIAERHGKPTVMVSREFADLFDGISYVNPWPVDLANSEIHAAVKLAQERFKNVLVTQIWGKNWEQQRSAAAYNIESWRMAGFEHEFYNQGWRPVFDRRNRERELLTWNKLGTTKPVILVNVTHSQSSPFHHGKVIMDAIRRDFGAQFDIVDIGGLHLERIYDLIGLMERSAALVTIDTSSLHLAAACNIPLVALVNPEPWLGSMPRLNCYGRMTYSEALAQPQELAGAIRAAATAGQSPPPAITVLEPPVKPILVHAVEEHNSGDPRIMAAQQSWAAVYADGVMPAVLKEDRYPRTAKVIGDRRALPFLKDVLKHGLAHCQNPSDIVFFTNDDNWLHPKLPEHLRLHVSIYECCSSFRCEYVYALFPDSDSQPEAFAANSDRWHMGRDLFAFTRKWLEEHWQEMPDFILGASDWDLCLAAMIRLHFGIESTRQNLEKPMFPAEIPRGYVSHKFHAPTWSRAENVHIAPSQRHNRSLFRMWANSHLPKLRFHANDCI